MSTSSRGFASMDRTRQREIASKGGRAAHEKGTAHEWTPEEAREAGRKGGRMGHRRPEESNHAPMSTEWEGTRSAHEEAGPTARDGDFVGRKDSIW